MNIIKKNLIDESEYWNNFLYDVIPTNKKGSKIKIKKLNKGKFTDYCGGKVTQECINRGKNSSSATIRKRATFADNARKWKHLEGGKVNRFLDKEHYTVGNLVDAIYQNNPKEEFLGRPSHLDNLTQSEEWANAHGYYPDAKGHRDDRVKKPAHPSHPSRGNWEGDNFILTDKGFEDPNYTLFGLNDGGQDPQATLIYNGGVVLPEITVTPKGNYIYNSYDNIKLHLKSNGGKINRFGEGGNFFNFIKGHKK